jgi:hypothetical protein
MRLTKQQQRAVMNSLPRKHKAFLHQYCQESQMGGDGIGNILKSIGSFGSSVVKKMTPAAKAIVKELRPVLKEVGPVVLKEVVVPLLKARFSGGGMKIYAGSGLSPAGGGLRLAGQRQRGRGRGGKSANPWLVHVNRERSKHPGLTYKEVLKRASSTYK